MLGLKKRRAGDRPLRVLCEKPVRVRGTIIGGTKPLICVPLTKTAMPDLVAEALAVSELAPDLVEWRADCYAAINSPEEVLGCLQRLREVLGVIPLIFTCRSAREGGQWGSDDNFRREVLLGAIESGYIDLVDCELSFGEGRVGEVRQAAKAAKVKLILSYHNFSETPSHFELLEKMLKAEFWGADIAKIAVMAKGPADVLAVLSAAHKARIGPLSIPLIAIAMGSLGMLSRVAGGDFGSDVTFAAGVTSSAPGQIHVATLRKLWELWPR